MPQRDGSDAARTIAASTLFASERPIMQKPALPSMPTPTHRNRSGRHVLSSLAALIALPCLAQPKFVYRFDTRPPEQIFSTGFAARGTNLDLRRYMSESTFVRSRGEANNPGFIAASEYSAAALIVGEYAMFRRMTNRGYVYRIRADEHFYDMNLSVRHLRDVSRAVGCADDANACSEWLEDVSGGISFMSDQALQSTFISDRAIPASMIASVDVVVSNGLIHIADHAMQQRRLNMQVTETIANPHYVDADTHANPNPYLRPELASVPPSPACRPPMPPTDDDDAGGAVGSSCEGDIVAVAGPSGYLHPGLLPDCPSSPQKRSVQLPTCTPPTMVNLSKLGRAMRVLIANDEMRSPDRNQGHDDL